MKTNTSKANKKARKSRKSKKSRSKKAKRNGYARRKVHARRKRNDGGGMAILKTVGIVFAGIGVAVGGMLLLSMTQLSAMAQDGILIGGGVVLGGAAMAMGHRNLGLSVLVAPAALGTARRVLSWGVTARAQELLNGVQSALGGANAAPANAAPAVAAPAVTTPGGALFFAGRHARPAGYLSATPTFGQGMPMAPLFGQPLANMTTPMAGYG